MTWGTYYFFYDCPECGKKYRWSFEDMNEEAFGQCPACHVDGAFVGESKDIIAGDTRFVDYEYI